MYIYGNWGAIKYIYGVLWKRSLPMVKEGRLKETHRRKISLRNDSVFVLGYISFLFSLSVREIVFLRKTNGTEWETCLGSAMTHFWIPWALSYSFFFEIDNVCYSFSLSLIEFFSFTLAGSFFQAKSCVLACRTVRSSRKRSAEDLGDPLQGNIGICNLCY